MDRRLLGDYQDYGYPNCIFYLKSKVSQGSATRHMVLEWRKDCPAKDDPYRSIKRCRHERRTVVSQSCFASRFASHLSKRWRNIRMEPPRMIEEIAERYRTLLLQLPTSRVPTSCQFGGESTVLLGRDQIRRTRHGFASSTEGGTPRLSPLCLPPDYGIQIL